MPIKGDRQRTGQGLSTARIRSDGTLGAADRLLKASGARRSKAVWHRAVERRGPSTATPPIDQRHFAFNGRRGQGSKAAACRSSCRNPADFAPFWWSGLTGGVSQIITPIGLASSSTPAMATPSAKPCHREDWRRLLVQSLSQSSMGIARRPLSTGDRYLNVMRLFGCR